MCITHSAATGKARSTGSADDARANPTAGEPVARTDGVLPMVAPYQTVRPKQQTDRHSRATAHLRKARPVARSSPDRARRGPGEAGGEQRDSTSLGGERRPGRRAAGEQRLERRRPRRQHGAGDRVRSAVATHTGGHRAAVGEDQGLFAGLELADMTPSAPTLGTACVGTARKPKVSCCAKYYSSPGWSGEGRCWASTVACQGRRFAASADHVGQPRPRGRSPARGAGGVGEGVEFQSERAAAVGGRERGADVLPTSTRPAPVVNQAGVGFLASRRARRHGRRSARRRPGRTVPRGRPGRRGGPRRRGSDRAGWPRRR